MILEPSGIADLLIRDLFNELNEEDRNILRQWLEADVKHRRLAEKMYDEPHWLEQIYKDYDAIDNEATWAIIQQHLSAQARRNTDVTSPAIFHNKAAIRYLLAGLCVSGICVAAIVYYPSVGRKNVIAAQPAPATDQAYMSYAGGPAIALQDYKSGWTTEKGNMVISKPSEGVVRISIRDSSPGSTDDTVRQVTLNTPMGGKYRIIMPDSSIINLNAASTVAFRESFNRQRKVSLRGEGYFEVQRQKDDPFVVDALNMLTVKSIGTVFDIKAYENDAGISASLVTGHVLIERQNDPAPHYLSPGQTYILNKDGTAHTDTLDQATDAVSWTNGRFDFEDQPITDILAEVGRWYNVSIEYHDPVTGHYSVQGSRHEPPGQLLNSLEKTGHMHFLIQPHTIIAFSDQP